MAFCTACGQPGNGASRFCTACGTPFADVPGPDDVRAGEQAPEPDEAFGALFAPRRDDPGTRNDTARMPPMTAGGGAGGGPGDFPGGPGPVGGPGGGPGGGWGGPGWESGPGSDWMARPPSRPGRSKIIAVIAGAVAVVAVGGALLGFEMHGRRTPPGGAAGSPATSPSPSRSARTSGAVVVVGPRVVGNPDTGPIVRLLTSYFTAINSHDYSGYQALLDSRMRRSVTMSQFAAGYRSTTDTAATLMGISTARDGRTVAAVTFTSHQNPSDSPDHSPCTIWVIDLFLEPSHGGFLIGPAQQGYHASHRSCRG